MKKSNLLLSFLFTIILSVSFSACSDEPDYSDPSTPGSSSLYTIWVSATEGSYILSIDDLMKDTVLSPANNQGIDISAYLPASYYGSWAYCYGGKYYISNDGARFSQFEITDKGQFKETSNLAFGSSFYIGNVLEYMSSDSEMVFTKTGGQRDEVKNVYKKPIYFMNTVNMTMTKELTAEIPFLEFPVYKENGDIDPTSMHVTSFEMRNDKVFFGYDFYNAKYGMATDTTYIYVCDYPSMQNGKVLRDGRGGYTSGHWDITRRAFFDDDKNLYFISENSAEKMSLIRIKNNETEIDADYFYDLSAYNVGSGNVQELGNGKTYLPPYIIDAPNKKIIADLRILADGAEPNSTTMNFVENGNLYTVFKTKDSRWFVYEYNPETNTMKRGIEIDGGIDWVYHINKLK